MTLSRQWKVVMEVNTQDRNKLKELMLYVARQSEDDPLFGSIKLNKVLFYSDFLAYGTWGQSITGSAYQRQEHGPCPRGIKHAQQELVDAGDAEVNQVRRLDFLQKRLIARREAKLDSFSGPEIGLINRVIADLRDLSATEVSLRSHNEGLWRFFDQKEGIPLSAVFLSAAPLPLQGIAKAHELAKQAS